MAIKFASLETLANFLNNCKNLFATKTELNTKSDKTHKHNIADIANLQSSLDGKANSSHGTHVSYSTTAPLMDGSSSVGSAFTVARSDHRHPTDTSRASQTSLDSHVSNTTSHITSTERTNLETAHTHSQSTHARTDATKVADSTTNGNILINGAETNVYIHPNSGISAGTYKSVTVNGQGHITSGSNPTTLSGFGITDGETKTDASKKLAEAKTYADNAATKVKNDLLSGAGTAYDTLKELGDLIDENTDAISALETVAAGKANKSHTHSTSDVTNLQSTLNNIQTQLDGKASSGHTHSYAASSSVGGAATSANKLNTDAGSTTQPVYFSNGIPVKTTYTLGKSVPSNAVFTDTHYASKNVVGATSATSNTTTALTNGNVFLNSVENGSVTSSHKISGSGATTVTTDTSGNIVINSANTTYGAAGSSLGLVKSGGDVTISSGVITVNDDSHNHTIANVDNLQTTLDGKADLSHNHSASNITSGTLSSDRLPIVPIAKGGTGSTTAAGALTNLGITATASELNKLDGVTATTTELNYVDGVTSNIQTQLNGKSSTSHTHSAASSSLGFVKSGGDVTISDGVITVNDDSHNHTISNIDNLQTTLNGKEDIISWSAITQGQTWSRICLVKANTGVVGFSGILSVGFTRGNVVGNATFAINASHSSTVYITQLNANKYSTFQIRGVTDSNANNTYIEIYDTVNSIASGTNQTMYCKFIPLLGCTVTKYTTFTSGTTIPSGYTAGSILTVDTSGGSMVASKFVGNLSGNAASSTKSTQDGSGNNIVNTYATKTELNNTKSNLQTQIDGKAASSHGTHVAWATSAPKANGTASVGTVARVAREDHVHPLQTSVSGNAGTSTTISKRVKITSSQSVNVNKYIKFGTVTLPNGYNGFMGYLMFNPTEGSGGANGLLHLYIRNGADNTSTSCTMKWLTLNDKKYEKTVFAVKVSNGVFDLYYQPINTWDTMEIIVISGDTHSTLALANSGTFVDSITATYTSSIGGQVSYANSAGSATSATTASTCTGNSATATKLSSAKTISLTGDVSGSTSFDGSGNASITTTVADDSHNHVISNIDNLQSTLDGKSATSHTHTAANLVQWADVLFGTNNQGGVEFSYGSGSGKNVLTEISNMGQGLHTVYAISGTAGNPKTNESFRFLIHKTSDTIGWILAWDAQGSLFTNYQSAAGTFKGWRCVYDANPSALWTGGYYMSSTDGNPQTVKPSKKLSECRNGWVLIWSDYDPNTSTKNNTDIHHDYVYKRNVAGANWSGQCMLCDIPRYMGSNANDVDTERRILKAIYIHDDRIEGSYQGSYDERNDVILRAIYEF